MHNKLRSLNSITAPRKESKVSLGTIGRTPFRAVAPQELHSTLVVQWSYTAIKGGIFSFYLEDLSSAAAVALSKFPPYFYEGRAFLES